MNLTSKEVAERLRLHPQTLVNWRVKGDGPRPLIEVEMADAWVWDMYRKTRFVPRVKVITFKDVNVEELPSAEL